MLEFLKELTHRKVWLFGGLYLALGWVLLQVAALLESTLELPDWIDQSVLVLLIIGFPVALLLAWAQESKATLEPDVAAEKAVTRRPAMSVAVLPVNNMSDERELGWVADGMSEDLISLLSMHDLLRVTARNSSFAWKGQSPDVRDVGEQLAVRYVIEGSLRVIEETIRITAQLIDAFTGEHVWAGAYDHAKSSLAGMQDDIVETIAAEVVSALRESEYDRVRGKPIENMDPLDICLLANDLGFYPMTKRGLVKATKVLEAGLSRAPESFELKASLCENYAWRATHEPDRRHEFRDKADKTLRGLLRIKSSSARVLEAACIVMRQSGRHEEHLFYAQELDAKSDVFGGYFLGLALLSHGRFDEAQKELEKWLARAGKRNNRRFYVEYSLVQCLLGLGRFEDAEKVSRQIQINQSSADVQALLLMSLGRQAKTSETAKELDIYLGMYGSIGLKKIELDLRPSFANQEFVDMMLESLRLAGLEEVVDA